MIASRKSRRLLDLDPKSNDEIPAATTKELKNLLNKGGRKGLIDPRHDDWSYFPQRNKRTTSMISISDLQQDIKSIKEFHEKQEEEHCSDTSHLLVHVNQIKSIANDKCKDCYKKGKNIISDKKVSFDTYGLSSAVHLTCLECGEESTAAPKLSSFAGKDYTGQPSQRRNNSWYESNLRFVIATLAIGNGGSDLCDFLAFADLPQATSFGSRSFNRIECLVGETIRAVAEQSMIEAWEEETRRTLEAQGKCFQKWKKTIHYRRMIVKLTVSFDMGWQKRSSGNK